MAEFITYTAPAKVNPYASDVAELLTQTEKNPQAAMRVVVAESDADKTIYKIQRAAIDIDRTASILVSDAITEGKDAGKWQIVVRLKDKRKSGPRKPRTRKGGTVADAGAIEAPKK